MKRRHICSLLIASLSQGCLLFPTVPEPDDDHSEPAAVVEITDAKLIGVTPQTDFAQSGIVRIAVLPKDAAGNGVIDDALSITVSTQLAGSDVSLVGTEEKQPNPDQVLSAALDLDSSGSMAQNDPMELRKDAAKQFVGELRDGDVVAVCDFGAGATDPFTVTRLLADFTDDHDAARAALDQIQAAGDTPMLESNAEVLAYYDKQFPAGSVSRALLVLGDGQPNGIGTIQETCAAAQQAGIPINTIGFGPAADKSPTVDPTAVQTLRDLADCSGGAYTGVVAASELANAFAGFGEAARSGSVTITVRFDPIPPSNTAVAGTVSVGNASQTPVELQYDFVAP